MKEKVFEILSEIRPEFDFTQNVNFIEEGILDSFDIVTFVAEVEERLGIAILGSDIIPENFSSIDGIVSLLLKSNTK